MILVHRYTHAGGGPFHATVRIKPAVRVDLIDVRGKLREEFGSEFTRYPKAFYISDHTTAGYLDQRLAKVLDHDSANIQDYLQVFLKLFPPGADYGHDKLHLRTELSEQQRAVEPRNADSHLAFMGSRSSNAPSSPATPTPTWRSWGAAYGAPPRTSCTATSRSGSWSWTGSMSAASAAAVRPSSLMPGRRRLPRSRFGFRRRRVP